MTGPVPAAISAGRATQIFDTGESSPVIGNSDCPWDQFDSDAYLQHNYAKPHDLDRLIIRHLGRFVEALGRPVVGLRGLDVGPGTNLYPALAMLPITRTITFWEHSAHNVSWLRNALSPAHRWDEMPWGKFWHLLRAAAAIYHRVDDPEPELKRQVADVTKRSIFELPKTEWDIGTMFFVAESITARYDEFEMATRHFLRALKPGSPFLAAFMENSLGYDVGTMHFPAVAITKRHIRRVLRGIAGVHQIHVIRSKQKFREGYTGMILVTGWRDHVTVNNHRSTRPLRLIRIR